MRSELEDSVRLLLFLDLSHEVDCINGNLLIEYDLSSRVGEQSQKWKLLHKQNGDAQFYFQRSTVIFRFMGPQSTMSRTYVPVYSFYPTASLTVRSILTTTSTTHHIILSVRTNHMYVVIILSVRDQYVRTCS